MTKSSDDLATQQVQDSLLHLARQDPPRLPTANQLWWRAAIIRRLIEDEATVRRAERPARWGQVMGLTFSVVLILMAFSAGLLVGDGSAVGPERIILALILPLLPVVGLVALFFGRA